MAGSLDRVRSGVRAGTLAGLAAAVPIGLVVLFLLGTTSFLVGTDGSLALVLGGTAVALAYTVGLSALGGLVGAALRRRLTPTHEFDD